MIFECVIIGQFWDEVYRKFPNFLTPINERLIKPDDQPLQVTFFNFMTFAYIYDKHINKELPTLEGLHCIDGTILTSEKMVRR